MSILLADLGDGAHAFTHPFDDRPRIPPGFDFTDPDACATGMPDQQLASLGAN